MLRKAGDGDAVWKGRWSSNPFEKLTHLYDGVTRQEGIFKHNSERAEVIISKRKYQFLLTLFYYSFQEGAHASTY
jgi:hypothetical protein